MLKLIASADRAWGIGLGQSLLFRIPEDMGWFKSHTMGKTVLLGRKTLESFPGGRPLPDRRHIVLTRGELPPHPQITVCATVEQALALAEGKEVWVIGGEQIYSAFLPHCAEAYITRVDALRQADRHLPNLDALPDWYLAQAGQWKESGGLRFRFCRYVRREDAGCLLFPNRDF